MPSVIDRFAAKIRVSDAGCWEWTGSLLKPSRGGTGGYARMKVCGRMLYAHRYAYETFIGTIPDGLEIDHKCRNRRCVNPLHLEPVTSRLNTLRSPIAVASINSRKTHCPVGHEYSYRNTHVTKCGRRMCRTCMRDRARLSRSSARKVVSNSVR